MGEEVKLDKNIIRLPKELNKALIQAVQGCNNNLKGETIDCINVLKGMGANMDAEDPDSGKTALMIACEKGYIEIVSSLIEYGAQIKLKDRRQQTPLFYAIEASSENTDVVMLLIKQLEDQNEK